MKFKNFLNTFFLYKNPSETYHFTLPDVNVNPNNQNYSDDLKSVLDGQNVYSNLQKNVDYMTVKYNSLINSDIIFRPFSLYAKGHKYDALLVCIDGMVNSELINNFILRPLMENKKSIPKSSKVKVINIDINKIQKFDLKDYIYNALIPQNSINSFSDFSEIIKRINMGDCAIFVDTISSAFVIDVKGFQTRSISTPNNETVVRGSQEAFVEKLRTNTSMLRRLINNENLIIENTTVGNISKTKVAICYMNNIANNNLVSEVKYRINNLDVDYIISSGQLEQLIQDNSFVTFPQIIATERPDKSTLHLLEGRVVVLVDGSPYSLIMPGVLIDFLSSPEDMNLKFQYSNLLKIIRLFAFIITLLLPGIYVAITSYHSELIPTELLFTIAASRNSVPFPVIFEILLMELSFELIREAGLRVPSPIGPTIRHCRCFNIR